MCCSSGRLRPDTAPQRRRGDSLTKDVDEGGLGLGPLWGTVALLVVLACLIAYQTLRVAREPLDLLPAPTHRVTGESQEPNGKVVTAYGPRRADRRPDLRVRGRDGRSPAVPGVPVVAAAANRRGPAGAESADGVVYDGTMDAQPVPSSSATQPRGMW